MGGKDGGQIGRDQIVGHVCLGKESGIYLKSNGSQHRLLRREVERSDLYVSMHAGERLEGLNVEVGARREWFVVGMNNRSHVQECY